MPDAAPLGPTEQTALAQYPCPGRCGIWVVDGNVACLACWYKANPLPRRHARALSGDHPRRPKPIPCPECEHDLAMTGHDRYCRTGQEESRR